MNSKWNDWYCVQVAAGCEKKAMADLLARKSVLGDTYIQDVEVPQTTSMTVLSTGKRKTVKTNILPGYILVQVKKERVEVEEGQFEEVFPTISHDTIQSTFNVLGFAGPNKNKPKMMRPSEVRNIFSFVDDTHQEVKENVLTNYKVNDKLSVVSGPFEGNEITVLSVKGNKIRAEIDIFGNTTTAEFTKDQLYKSK